MRLQQKTKLHYKKQTLLLLYLFIIGIQPIYSQSKKDYLITIHTKFGEMNLVLYDKTPKHKANFLKLVNDKFYDSTLFHRVMQNFMIQGGDPKSKKAKPGEGLGNGDVGYKIPAEILPDLFHKKGALAAARGDNPLKESSGCQFYIVQGKTWNEPDLEVQIKRSGRPFTEAQRTTYKTLGGSPHLDGNYTVFGQLISGIAVVDSIISVKKDQRNRPDIDIQMKITAKKMRKKKIVKKYADKSIAFSF
jgi:cyclophilin family peptidyl-prolyl cis-trans isomerase